ncbi:aminotransferase class IV [Proteiniclasticum sp. C24MP]|uniref:aminotransferase class IV n=1 Tax=Proteiniclasticum sp. C24MP TaxID=3374101 RepID=UPI00375489F0
MDTIRGSHVTMNNSLVNVRDFSYRLSRKNVYEVIRITDGTPLFLEDHLERMNQSLEILQMDFRKSKEEISNLIHLLAKKNGIKDGNVKILINHGPVTHFYMYFIPHVYPDRISYLEGIRTGTMEIERKNPNAKVIDPGYKTRVTEFIEENGIYEALLVNSDHEITEGSKSNVFFVLNQTLYTPPLKDVLGGVTRKRILDIAAELKMNIAEEAVPVTDLPRVEAAFISGTSPKILPISSIDDMELSSSDHPMVKKLMAAYEQKIEDDLLRNR